MNPTTPNKSEVTTNTMETHNTREVEEWREDFLKLKAELGEVPENTCPNIDKALNELAQLEKDVSYLQSKAHNYETGEDMARELPDVGWLDTPDILEKLRKDNDQLRHLGREWYQFSKRLVESMSTTHHQQLQKAREEEREQLLRTLLNSLPLRSDWDDDQKVTFQMCVNAMREVLESYLPPPTDYPPTNTQQL